VAAGAAAGAEEEVVIILWIILWVAAGLPGLLLLLLLVPAGVSVRGAVHDLDMEGDLRVWWGLEAIRVPVKTGKKGRGSDGTSRSRSSGPGLRWLLRHRRVLLRAALRLLGPMRPEGRVAGSLGTWDPADTAAVFAVLRMMEGRMDRLHVDLVPRYVDEGWDLEGRLRIRVWPIRTAAAALGLLLRRDMRRALTTARG